MQEIRELQAYNRKEFATLAVMNFKHLIFKFTVLNKLNNFKKLRPGTVEAHQVKNRLMELLLQHHMPHIGDVLARTQGELCELKFKHRNLERKYI